MKPKHFIIALIVGIGILIHQVLIPVYTGEGSFLYANPGKGYVELKQEIKNYEASLSKADQIISEARKVKTDYEKVTPEHIEKLKAMVPDEISEVKLHSEVSSILRNNGFSSEKLGLSEKTGVTSVAGVGAYTITFSLEDTDYQKIKDFIKIIEHSRRIIAIKSVSVSPSGEVGGGYKFDVSAETYFMAGNQVKK